MDYSPQTSIDGRLAGPLLMETRQFALTHTLLDSTQERNNIDRTTDADEIKFFL